KLRQVQDPTCQIPGLKNPCQRLWSTLLKIPIEILQIRTPRRAKPAWHRRQPTGIPIGMPRSGGIQTLQRVVEQVRKLVTSDNLQVRAVSMRGTSTHTWSYQHPQAIHSGWNKTPTRNRVGKQCTP